MTLNESKMEGFIYDTMYDATEGICQGTEEWHKQRMGKFTASRFATLMTNSRKKDEVLGQSAITYIYEKAAEILTGERTESFGKALDWGIENEAVCKEYYQEKNSCIIQEMPFVQINEYSGGSPDGMVEDDNIEIKCPFNTINHLKTAFEGYIDPKYMWQMQGCMLATGAENCRYISFDPRVLNDKFKMVEINVAKDVEMQEQLLHRLEYAHNYLSNLLNSK